MGVAVVGVGEAVVGEAVGEGDAVPARAWVVLSAWAAAAPVAAAATFRWE